MHLKERIQLLLELGRYMRSESQSWLSTREKARSENSWFIPEFTDRAINQISNNWLQEDKLTEWAGRYHLETNPSGDLKIGIVMAGNIPLVGFHDFLACFISGKKQLIKTSSRDNALIADLISQLHEWEPATVPLVAIAERLNGCDAYIATGSNNSARYFDYYFGKYPHIIRQNRSSVAILDGSETRQELEKLADDVYLYFGRGCRNVTKLYVPEGYDFLPLLETFRKYNWLADFSKYKHNYDYQLSIQLLNNVYYMSNESLLLVENPAVFSPISVLHYEYDRRAGERARLLKDSPEIQCLVGHGLIPFGQAQFPGLEDYADGTDTLQFLRNL